MRVEYRRLVPKKRRLISESASNHESFLAQGVSLVHLRGLGGSDFAN